jgi:hypothetical protein
MDAAAKAAQAEARKKSKATGAKIETSRTSVNEKPERQGPPPAAPPSPGLFDSAPQPTEATPETKPRAETVNGISDEDQAILDEIKENEEAAESRSDELDEAD